MSARDGSMASKNTDPKPVEAALDAAVAETKRLVRELADTEETRDLLADLLALLVFTWRAGGDLGPIMTDVEATLDRLHRVN